MKKLFFSILVAVFCCLCAQPIFADDTPITIIIKKKSGIGSGGIGSGSPGHAPMHLPIEVIFDDATGVLSVQAPEDMEGCVYVYNINGGLEASSDHLNTTLTLPSSGMHIVSLQGDSWIGEGRFIF